MMVSRKRELTESKAWATTIWNDYSHKRSPEEQKELEALEKSTRQKNTFSQEKLQVTNRKNNFISGSSTETN